MPSTSSSSHAALVALAAARWRIGLGLTAAMTFIYVVFILLIAYGKTFLGTLLAPGPVSYTHLTLPTNREV